MKRNEIENGRRLSRWSTSSKSTLVKRLSGDWRLVLFIKTNPLVAFRFFHLDIWERDKMGEKEHVRAGLGVWFKNNWWRGWDFGQWKSWPEATVNRRTHRGSWTALVVMLIWDLWGGFALFFVTPAWGFYSYLHITQGDSVQLEILVWIVIKKNKNTAWALALHLPECISFL